MEFLQFQKLLNPIFDFMKKLTQIAVVAVALFASLPSFGQRRGDGPVYYTDSKVERRYASFGIHGDPLFTQRRLFALNNADANSQYDKDDYPATGGFGYNWGGYVNFNINSSLRLGVGAGQTVLSYRLDNYAFVPDGGDTASVGLNIRAQYNTFPLRIGFTTPMNDVYDLEIWVPIAYNKLTSYTENTRVAGTVYDADLTDEAKKDMWSVAIQIGAAFHLTDNWSLTAAAQFRYFTTPIIEKANRPTETPYGVGLSLGLRYRLQNKYCSYNKL